MKKKSQQIKSVLRKLKDVKLLLLDVDGVLTKGELIILDDRKNLELKIWDIKDRFAYTMLRKSGLDIKIGWISGRGGKELENRAKELRIEYFYQWVKNKLEVYEELLRKSGYTNKDVVYIGDDWLDIPILKRAYVSICPKDAVKEVKRYVDYISHYPGGRGVFREVVELILKSKGKFNEVFSQYNI
ncbi:MAG: HAD hydrolase family protein [Endomicrobia bacterium]|nr:HAD hydrolase family protein [Endomicrobiia bacterium]MCX7940352.1 HAD hydrolase family protein [Endomicrobiia bacterium]MDW8055217.1 HAD hydrolase family protein [Elusimicrobiota bacterium]